MTDTKPARDPRVVAAATLAAKHGGQFNGKKNAYVCQEAGFGNGCGRTTITIDREPGVTPFMTTCPHCGGSMKSRMYRIPQDLTPTMEWYRPDTLDGLSQWTVDHVLQGGLISRWIDSAGEELMAAFETALRESMASSGPDYREKAARASAARAYLVAAVGPQRFSDEQVLRIIRAHDAEDSAQRGEPSLWDLRQRGDFANDLPEEQAGVAWKTHVDERMAAMRAGLKAIDRG